jgi:fibronectin type 3 domain-containing protein
MWSLDLKWLRDLSRAAALLVTLGTAVPVAAQDGGSLFVFRAADEVRLRWNAPFGRAYEGFHVERRAEPGGGWQRLTTEPVPRVADVAEIRLLLGHSAEALLTFFEPSRSIDAEEWVRVTSDPVASGMIGLLTVQNAAMARVLGERFDDHGIEESRAFSYRIVMVAPGGGESQWAATARPLVHGEVDRVPTATGLVGEGGDGLAALGWRHDDERSRSGELVAYRVERSLRGIGPFAEVSLRDVVPTRVDGELPEYLHTDRGLINGTSYWYRIRGVNLVGAESEPTDPIEVVPRDRTPPPPPTGLQGRVLEGRALLRWLRVEVDDLAGYAVYRALDFSGPFQRVAPAKGQDAILAPAFFDAGMRPGDIFWYHVTSLDASGNESRPSDVIQVFLEDTVPPDAPAGVEAVGGEDGIRLSWQENREDDLAGYLVERGTDQEGPFFGLHSDPLDELGYLDPVPEHSQTEYAYRVVAIDDAWNRSAASDVVTARRPDAIPPAPPALYAVRLEEDRVVLEWGRSSEPDVAGYRVYRSDDDNRFEPVHRELIPAEATSFEDRPDGGERYLYRMTAVDASSNESPPTASVTVVYMDVVPPDPPTGFRGEVVDGAVSLQWRVYTEADWEAIVLYRTDQDGRRRVLGRLAPDRSSFTDRRVQPGATYTYTAHSVDGAGNMSEPSEPAEMRLDEQQQPEE